VNILISNDDGVFSPGLAVLATAVRHLGEVHIVAPEHPQSAKAHSITLHKPLSVRHIRLEDDSSFRATSVDGSPADCVRLAIKNLLETKPDLVLSGINIGANVGINVLYSGTVAAAAEAAMMGIPAVAFSADVESPQDIRANFQDLVEHCGRVLDDIMGFGLKPGRMMNVNIPVLASGNPRGIVACVQSDAFVEDKYVEKQSADGNTQYLLADKFDFTDPHHESDIARLREGYITITPLQVDLTDYESLEKMEKNLENKPGDGIV